MSLLSSSVSVTRFRVEGKLEDPLLDTVAEGLKKYIIPETDNNASEKTVGWTSFDNPYKPDFKGSSFSIGGHLIFSLRIDKKTLSSKVIKKHCTLETAKKLADSGREYLSTNEKKMIRDHVVNVLYMRVPSTPNLYDLVWNYEDKNLWFFSNLKSANEEMETLFCKSFKINLIRLFPYTMAELTAGLSDNERDLLNMLSPSRFIK